MAGSREDLNKSEHEHEAVHKRLCREIGAERGQSVSKDLSHGLKHSGAVEADVSVERSRPKEHRTERGRSRERRHTDSPDCPPPHSYLFTPTAPSHPIRGSGGISSAVPSMGSAPASQGLGTGVTVPADAPPSSVMHWTAQGLGQLTDV